MANRTVKDASSVKGTNPQYLIEKIIRTRIYESQYWKEQCFALTAALLVDKAMALKYIGGVYGGNVKPTPFVCLVLKMLQIQPEKDIIVEFISQQDYKYVRALGAVYMRLVGTSLDCYKYLEPLYLDYRKLKRMDRNGAIHLINMDEFIDEILHEERVSDCILPRIQKRFVLEENNELDPRISALDDDVEDMESSDEDEGEIKDAEINSAPPVEKVGHRDWDRPRRSPSPRYHRSRSRSPVKRRERERDRDREHEREREHVRHREERDRHRERPHVHVHDRDRERGRRSRSKEREKDKHRSSHRHRQNENEERSRHHKSKRSKRDKDSRRGDHDSHSSKMSREELDIKQANELRAKLGMAPLKL